MPPRLHLHGITKRFGGTLANDDVSLRVAPGEIHALLGENGAGKSTLMKIVYGLLRPDSGSMLWDGRPIRPAGPHEARALGIGMVFQHFSLFERMSVAENVALGTGSRLRPAALARQIVEVSHAYGLPLDPARPVNTLSVGERQRVEIVRCLLQSPRLLIMDEPTSVLTPQEAEGLFGTLRRLAADGCAVLYISHKLAEIRALCSAATVLRAGRTVATCDPATETPQSLARLMLGTLPDLPERARASAGPIRLEVRGLDLPAASPHGTALRDIGFSVRGGEVFGIAGVAGNGQAELFAALTGERRGGSVRVDGVEAGARNAAGRRRLGLCAVPEDRLGHAAVPRFDLAENALLTGARRAGLAPGGVVRPGRARRFAARVIDAFDVRCSGPGAAAAELSGGNLQKFVVGRELLQSPAVLVAAQPSWGVDAGAAAAIGRALLALAAAGAAVVLISQDLDELRALCDRLAVIAGGRLSEAAPTASLPVEAIGLMMAGGVGHAVAH